MVSIERTVLVGLTAMRGAEFLGVIGHALARSLDARLIIVSLVIVPPHQSLSRGARPVRAQRQGLQRALEAAEAAGVSVETPVRVGHAADEALATVVAEVDVSLLVSRRC